MRLPSGFGGVCKLSGNRRRPFMARIVTGHRFDTGSTIYKIIGYYETRQAAINALADFNRNPYDVDLSQSTVADLWDMLKKRKFEKLSASTISAYQSAYKRLSPLHGKKMKEIKTYQMQCLLDNADVKGQMKSHMLTLMHQFFQIAMELDICQKNYASFVKIEAEEQSSIHKPFTSEEIQELFKLVFSDPVADAVLILIYSGMRPSELLEVKTENVHISERYMKGGLKTKAGKNRIIPINDKIMPFIKKRYNPENEYLISPHMPYHIFRSRFNACMETIGAKHLPHDGRHTFASMMDSSGVNKLSIKKIMGHSAQDLTDDVYTHKGLAELLQAVNKI